MNKSESISNLAVALSKAQAELPIIKFDSVNPFLKNRFASLGAIVEGARPVLAKYGLAVSQLVYSEGNPSMQITVNRGSKGEIIDSTEVSESTIAGVETILLHSSGEWISQSISMPVGDEKGKSSAQVAGSIITYLRRYSFAAILGIIADEDGDGAKPALSPREKRAVGRESAEQSDPVTDLLVETFATDAPKNNGNKYARPMSPEVLKEALQVKKAKSNPATEKQTNLVRILLLEHFADREDERHQAQEYLTGHKSFKDIEPEMISAILDWMKPEKSTDGSGAYVLGKDSKIELTMVARKFMEEHGQQQLNI